MSHSVSLAPAKPQQSTALFLQVAQGRSTGRIFRILSFPFTIGRGPGCQLKLADALASRKHCVLEKAQDEILIRDLGSRNGTSVNSRRVTTPLVVNPGDLILVGSTMLRLRQHTWDQC